MTCCGKSPLKRSPHVHAPKHLVKGQSYAKHWVSHSFKTKCLNSAPSRHPLQKAFQRIIKALFLWGGGKDRWPHNKNTYTCITRTRTRSLHFKQKNLRASRAGRTKSTSLPLFIVSLADRPTLPANSTFFWTVTDSAQLPQSIACSSSPLRDSATHFWPLTEALQPLHKPWASAAPSATLLLPPAISVS